MDNRVALIGIMVENPDSIETMNRILHEYGQYIICLLYTSIDGVAFEGGKGTNYNLTIGSHSFIGDFEEQLIGKNAGEACEVNVTFPEEYHASELAGKPAQFKVTVKEVKEKQLPELNDEFAGEVSEFETLAEYKEDIKKSLLAKKEADAKGCLLYTSRCV